MRLRLFASTATVALALALGTAPAALAQNTQSLTKKEAKKLLKQSEKDLKKTKKASNRGDGDAAAEHASNFAENMNRLNRGLSASHMSDHAMLDVAAKVDEATLRHKQVLEDVRNEKLTPEYVRREYGVVVTSDPDNLRWQVDLEATERLKAEMRKSDR